MKDMRCACGNMAKYYKSLNFNGEIVEGWVCESCKEVYYNPEQVERILILNKLKKKSFDLKLNKVKSNLILRIPKDVSDALGLDAGHRVKLRLDGKKRIVVG